MKKTAVILLLGLLMIDIMAAGGKIDDLESQLKWAKGEQKIDILLQLTGQYKTANPQKVIERGEEALTLLKQFPAPRQEVKILIDMGWAYIAKGQYENGLTYLNQGRKKALKFGYRQELSDALFTIAGAYRKLSNYDLAMQVSAEVLNIRLQLGDQRAIAESYRGIGQVYSARGDFDKALENYWHALNFQDESKDREGIANTYTDIGTTYLQLGKYPEAERYYKKSLEIHRQLENKLGILLCLNNLVTVARKKADTAAESNLSQTFYLETLNYYRQALQIQEDLGYRTDIVMVASHMAEIYEKLNRYKQARETYLKALKLAKELGEKPYEAHVLGKMSLLYSKEGEYDRALDLAFQALRIAEALPSELLRKQLYQDLSEIYAARGDYQSAYDYYKKFKIQSDEILDTASSKRTAEMEALLNTKEKERQIEILEEKEKRHKNLLGFYLVVGVLILIIALINFGLYRTKKKAEAAVRESEEKYRQLVERANDGIAVLQEGVFQYVNPRFTRLLGYSLEELVGLPIEHVAAPEEKERLNENYFQQVRGETGAKTDETILVHKDGTRIDVEINADVIPYENRLANLVFIRDTREQKQLEEERLKRSKLESIGLLAGGIAHDFNNILGIILGYIELWTMGLPAGSRHANTLAKAEQAVVRAKDLARQFLTFSEGGMPVRRVVSLEAIVSRAVDHAMNHPVLQLQGEDLRQHLDIKIDLAADLGWVHGDPQQLEQALGSLIINAVEAVFPRLTLTAGSNGSSTAGQHNGLIEITAENARLEAAESVEPRQIGYLQAGNYIRLTVRDQGEGIKKENLAKIFDPYFSTRNRFNQKGLGLGLTVVYSIIKRHLGDIDVTSEPGKGTTVTLYLPALDKESLKPETTAAENN